MVSGGYGGHYLGSLRGARMAGHISFLTGARKSRKITKFTVKPGFGI